MYEHDDDAPDLTLVAKNARLADALVTILTEGLEDFDEAVTADGRTITATWSGVPRDAINLARVAILTGVADGDEGQAMLDRAAAWDMNLSLDEVIELREEAEAKLREEAAQYR